MKSKLTTTQITKIALMIAFVSVSSYIIIPLPFTPIAITGQTLVINLIAMVLTPKEALFTTCCYWLLGFVGAPVFSGGTSGPGKMLGPSGGYCVGFIIAAVLIAWLRGKKYNPIRYSLVGVFVGIPALYGIALVWMKLMTDMTWQAAFVASVLPFIPLELVKIAGAVLLAKPIQSAFYALEATGGKVAENKL